MDTSSKDKCIDIALCWDRKLENVRQCVHEIILLNTYFDIRWKVCYVVTYHVVDIYKYPKISDEFHIDDIDIILQLFEESNIGANKNDIIKVCS